MPEKQLNLICLLAIAALGAALFLPWLGSITLFDVDEPRFAEAGRVMAATGDYLVPYFNGEVRYDKPPLVYWVMVAGYRIVGVNELGARIGSAAAGIGSCLLVFLLSNMMFGRRAALIASAVAATTLLFFVESRTATADSLLLLTVLLMFTGFWRVQSGRRGILSWLLLYGGLAAGSLTKGPVSLAVLVVSVAIYALLRRENAGRKPRQWLAEMRQVAREMHLVIGVLAAVAVVLAWFIPALIATHGGFLTDGFYRHVVQRSVGSEAMEGHRGIPVIFYLVILPAAFFPWFAILPESIRRLWRSPGDRGRKAFLLAWAIAPFIVFSFLRTKLPHYTMPAYPALAIICGWALDAAITRGEGFWKHWLGKAGIITFAIIGLAFAAGVAVFPSFAKLPALSMLPLGIALLVLTGWLVFTIGRRPTAAMIAATTAIAAAALLTAVGTGAATFGAASMYRNLASDVKGLLRPGDAVAHVGTLEPSLVFYLQRPVPIAETPEQLAGLANRNGRCICIAEKSKTGIIEMAGGRKLKEGRYFSTRKMKWKEVTVWEVDGTGALGLVP